MIFVVGYRVGDMEVCVGGEGRGGGESVERMGVEGNTRLFANSLDDGVKKYYLLLSSVSMRTLK